MVEGSELRMSAKIGIAVYPADGTDGRAGEVPAAAALRSDAGLPDQQTPVF
jgi:hypothetical protein